VAQTYAAGALQRFPKDPELAGLKAEIRDQIATERRRSEIANTVAVVRAAINSGELERARLEAEQGLRMYLGEPSLLELRQEIVERINRFETEKRHQAADAAAAEIRKWIAVRDWRRARDLIAGLGNGDPYATSLATQLTAGLESARLSEVTSQFESALQGQDWGGADSAVKTIEIEFPKQASTVREYSFKLQERRSAKRLEQLIIAIESTIEKQ